MNAPRLSSSLQWRTLEELSEGYAFHESSLDEFAEGAGEWPAEISRRRFLQLLGASISLTGTACTRLPREQIVPYVRQPEPLTPGKPLFFATAMELGGTARGLLVRSDEGRPTKIEGNPDHPGSLGRSSVHMQAELLSLYDPWRSQTVSRYGRADTWEGLLGELAKKTAQWKEQGGARLRLLTRQIGSPVLLGQIGQLLAKFPQAKWHLHDAAFPSSPLRSRVRLDRAKVILSLDADVFGPGGADVRTALDFARMRRSETGMNRLYVIESMASLTGSMADHRKALKPSMVAAFAETLAKALTGGTQPADPWAAALVRDLQQHRGRSVVLTGEFQPAPVHRLAQEMNASLGNIGQTIEYPADDAASPRAESLAELVKAMRSGEVQALLILGGNPAYDAPVDLGFVDALAKVPFTLHHGIYGNETAACCQWHVPESHFLEAWSDGRAFDDSRSIIQPLIEPLYPSRSAHELLAALLEELPIAGYEIVRAAWRQQRGEPDFERFWRKSLHDGFAAPPVLDKTTPAQALKPSAEASAAQEEPGLELIVRPDPHLLDGRYAENAWLQELPKPLTQLTWENAAHVSPTTAAQLGLNHGDIAELRYRGRSIRAPVWVLPGHADGCITIHTGHGRTHGGPVGTGIGFNAYALQTSNAPWGGSGLVVRRTGERHTFATTQSHQRMEGREPVRIETIGATRSHSGGHESPAPTETLYPGFTYDRPAWGMVIDLNTCIGCSACTIACQAENNIPVVGREQVIRGREMHWIRVDRYYSGSPDAPQMLHQPVPCMHCEKAPCELVCPVAATVHDHEGLNVMVYNRCIGTRYCSNNCPYKVRRFNFFRYNDNDSPTLKMMRNPEVSVRMRGVMEKCTYCVQRISAGRIAAEKEMRPIRDGEVVPACAQACPADAIIFGDINDPESRVASLRKHPRHYALLAELNTRPRTTYLARVRNPNPEIG